ncbi:hypothetical protein [Roseimicrobium sp. ORNL1]|uniref:hypothetical protein n=1 Tax=Roseimicrobium sp. ORNL1 TaxID=2711231 RepID=UPI00197F0AC8|nr:hypothetical protein [Roseimicrobium sp. ORNL1]
MMTKVSIHTNVTDRLALIRPGIMAFLLLVMLMAASHLEAAPPILPQERTASSGPLVLLAAIDGETAEGASDQEWTSVVKEHKSGLLAGGAVLGGIILFSALILAFMVRRVRQLHGTPAAESGRRGAAFIPSMREAKVLSKARGAKAFPVTPEGKPARSGDTTRLTLEEELASVEDETPDAPMPPLRTPLGAGIWAVVVAWICLVVGLGLMIQSPGSLAVCAPLFLIAVLLAVTAMAQRLVLHGSLVLAALYLAVPAVWITQYLGSEEDVTESQRHAASGAQTSTRNPTSDPAADARKLYAQQEALLKSKPGTSGGRTPSLQAGAPPAVWKQITPANKTSVEGQNLPPILPAEANEQLLPAMRVPGLPPAPPKMAGALFSYRARLGHADHLDPNGVDLRNSPQTTFGDILLQERLHVHQFNKRDPEDSVDAEFATLPLAAYRALFIGKEVKLPRNVLLFQLLKDDIIVDVQVFRDFLDVQVVSTRE